MKKKSIFLLLSAVAVSALASCGSSNTNTSSSANTSSEETSSKQESSNEGSSADVSSSEGSTQEESSSAASEQSQESSEATSQQSQPEESSEQTIPEASYGITLKNDTIVTLAADKLTADEDDEVLITATIIDGFELDDISVKAGDTNVLVSKTDAGWSFFMPDSNVEVSATYHRKSYNLSFTDPKDTIVSVSITPIGQEAIDYDSETPVEYEALVTVTFENSDLVTVNGVSLVGEGKTYSVNDQNVASFRMTAKDLEVEVLYTVKDVELVSRDTDHLTATFYDEDGNEITATSKSTTVYVGIESEDDDRYSVATIEFQFSYGSDITTQKRDISTSYDETTGLYHFYVPDTSKLTLVLTERDAIAFEDSSIVGTYLSTGLISKNSTYSKENDWKTDEIEICESGEIIVNSASYQIKELDDEEGVATLTNYSTIYYGNNFVLVGNGNAGALTTPYNSYDNLWVKKLDETDSDDLYTNSLVTFTYDNQNYRMLQVFRDGQPYASCYIDVTNQVAHFDVTFNFVNSCTKIHEDKAQYEITLDGENLAPVGYKDEGGANNRIIMEGVYGDYANEDSIISFLGEGHAVYEDVTYTVADNGDNSVTLSSNTKTITLQLDLVERTYVITDEQEVEATLSFKGHLYRGSFYNPWDEVTNYFFMSFDATDDTFISCVGTNSDIAPGNYSYGARYMSNNSSAYGDPAPQTYTYDAPTGTLTTTIFDCANRKNMTFIYSQANDTFTCQTEFTSNMFKTSGMVMTLVA